jgi:hypothetical protein
MSADSTLRSAPVGSELWRLGYTHANGKKNRLTLGAYPVVTLAAAREKRLKVKQQIDAGTDPAQARRAAKQQRTISAANTFEVIAREWHANKADSWKENTLADPIQIFRCLLRARQCLAQRSRRRFDLVREPFALLLASLLDRRQRLSCFVRQRRHRLRQWLEHRCQLLRALDPG